MKQSSNIHLVIWILKSFELPNRLFDDHLMFSWQFAQNRYNPYISENYKKVLSIGKN